MGGSLTRDLESWDFIRRLFFSGLQELCKRRLWKWMSLSIGALLGGTWRVGGSSTGVSWETDERGLWKWRIALHGSSARGTWREDSFTGDLEGLEMDISHNRGLMGNLEGRVVYQWLSEMVKGGSGNTAAVCMVALWGECGGRASLLGTVKDMQKKALETGFLLHRGPFGGPERGHLPGTLRGR